MTAVIGSWVVMKRDMTRFHAACYIAWVFELLQSRSDFFRTSHFVDDLCCLGITCCTARIQKVFDVVGQIMRCLEAIEVVTNGRQ